MNRPSPTGRPLRTCIELGPTLRALFGTFAVAGLVTTLVVPAAAEWKGTEETRDGVPHVMNPNAPANGSVSLDLEELWRLGGETDDPDEFFGVLSAIAADEDGNVYLLDSQLAEVKVYSAGGEFLRTIGREGEGPGEFRNANGMFFLPDGNLGVLQAAPAKIVKLTPMGDPAGEFPSPQIEVQGFMSYAGGQYDGGNLVCMINGSMFDQEKGTFTQSLMLRGLDNEGKVTAKYHEESRLWEMANPVIDEVQWDTIQNRWTVASDGRVMGCPNHFPYEVHVWKKDGTLERVIHTEHEKRKRTADEIERIRSIYEVFTRQAPNSELKIEDHDKAINSIYTRDDGSLWVLSSYGAHPPEGTIGVFDVYDKQGRFTKQVTLKGEGDSQNDGYFFVGDRLYVVTQLVDAAVALQGGMAGSEEEAEEATPMAVICYRIDDSKLAMN